MTEKEIILQNLMRLIRQNPNDKSSWLALAQIIEDPAKKSDCYRQVLRIDPNNPEAKSYLLSQIKQTKQKEISPNNQQQIPKDSQSTSLKSLKKNNPNNIGIWIGCSLFIGVLFCVLSGLLIRNVSKNMNRPSLTQPTSTPLAKIYMNDASSYVESITGMPSGFQIVFNLDTKGTIAYGKGGTLASRTFFNSDTQPNKINTVLFFVAIYKDIEDAKEFYESEVQGFSSPRKIIGDFDEGVYKFSVEDASLNIIRFEEVIRKSNAVILISCWAGIDENTDTEMIAMWSVYFHNLLLSKFE